MAGLGTSAQAAASPPIVAHKTIVHMTLRMGRAFPRYRGLPRANANRRPSPAATHTAIVSFRRPASSRYTWWDKWL